MKVPASYIYIYIHTYIHICAWMFSLTLKLAKCIEEVYNSSSCTTMYTNPLDLKVRRRSVLGES